MKSATNEELRRALGDLLADVTSGNLSGVNPWCRDSVKKASEVLTGNRFGFDSSEWKGGAK